MARICGANGTAITTHLSVHLIYLLGIWLGRYSLEMPKKPACKLGYTEQLSNDDEPEPLEDAKLNDLTTEQYFACVQSYHGYLYLRRFGHHGYLYLDFPGHRLESQTEKNDKKDKK